jgi:hypothetical protein
MSDETLFKQKDRIMQGICKFVPAGQPISDTALSQLMPFLLDQDSQLVTALESQRRDELKSAYDSDRAKGEALSVIATEMKKLRELLEAGLADPREGQAK